MLAAYGPSPGPRPGMAIAEADDPFHRLLVVHRVAPLADDVEIGQERVDGREGPAGQARELDAGQPPLRSRPGPGMREPPSRSR